MISLDEVMRAELHRGFSALIRRERETRAGFLCAHVLRKSTGAHSEKVALARD